MKRFWIEFAERMDKFKNFRLRRFQGTNRKNAPGGRQAKIATEGGINTVCDYDRRSTGGAHRAEFACLEFGNTSHIGEE